jgi:hypothetical protein
MPRADTDFYWRQTLTVDADAARLRLSEAARTGIEGYVSEYLNSLDSVPRLSDQAGKIRCETIDEAATSIKIGLLYNETALFDMGIDSNQLHISWLTEKYLENLGVSREMQATFPAGTPLATIENIKAGRHGLGFVAPKGEEVDQLMSDMSRLVQTGRLLPQPVKTLFHHDGKSKAPTGGRMWQTLRAQADSSLDLWQIAPAHVREPTVTEKALDSHFEAKRIDVLSDEIALPYVSGVSLTDYADIVEDEADLLVELRAAMKAFVDQVAGSGKDVREFRADVLEPRIAKINRAFSKIAQMKRLRAGGAAVATGALTLLAYTTGGVAGAIAAAAGGGGLLSFVKEVADANDKAAALKDDPLYLLWRLRRASRTAK